MAISCLAKALLFPHQRPHYQMYPFAEAHMSGKDIHLPQLYPFATKNDDLQGGFWRC